MIMSAASSNNFRQYLTALTLTLPPILFFKETFYSFYRVEGSSMEPALKDGDVLLVRKADIYPRHQWAKWTSSPSLSSSTFTADANNNNSSDDDLIIQEEKSAENENALKVIALDAQSQRPIGNVVTGYTFLKPPTIHQSGSIVVFRAPDAEKYPSREYRVKRVIGLGGQIVRPVDTFHGLERVPPFGLWVEGDNHGVRNNDNDNGIDVDSLSSSDANDDQNDSKFNNSQKVTRGVSSIDSRHYGPISKNLVIGVAERIVWPPSRWGMLPRMTSPIPRAWWPDF